MDTNAIEESARFEWSEVSDYARVIDLGLGGDGESLDLHIEESLSQDLVDTSDDEPDVPLLPPIEASSDLAQASSDFPQPASASDFETISSDIAAAAFVVSEDVSVENGGDIPGYSVDLEPVQDAVFVPEEIASADLPLPPPKDPTKDLSAPQVFFQISCSNCKSALGQCVVGGITPPLGLVAELRPFWSPERQRVVSVPRLKSTSERQAGRELLGRALLNPVNTEFLFDVADLSSPAVEQTTGAKLRVNELVKELRQNPNEGRLEAACPLCGAHAVDLKRDV